MKFTKGSKFVKATLLALILLVATPVLTFAQGRGRGRGQDKKNEKFVNGHDARDGRWDGRGPNRTNNITRHRRWRNRDGDNRYRRTRRVDRDGDGDYDRNDVRLGRRNRVDRDGDGDYDRNDVRLGRRTRRVTRSN